MSEWWQQFIDWLTSWFEVFNFKLDPFSWIEGSAEWASVMLPDPWLDAAGLTGQVAAAVNGIARYIAFIDFFVNLEILATVLLIMVGVESGLLAARAWRFIRSFIT